MSRRLLSFLYSCLAHLSILGSLVWLVFKPLYLPFAAACSVVVIVIGILSTLRSRRRGREGFSSYVFGSSVAVVLFLLGATLVGWIASSSPAKPLSLSNFIAYLSRAPMSGVDFALLVLPPAIVLGAVMIGHGIGLRWRAWRRREAPVGR